ncbi:MAG: extensin family protein [Myxococcota bacterium]|nr:extensin family protein [Myxococcota bacterium]
MDESELDESELGESELGESEFDESEFEYETNKRAKCPADAPTEVLRCGPMAGDKAVMCKPGADLRCPPLKETWHSLNVAGVPLHYGASVVDIRGGRHKVASEGSNDGINVVPAAWKAAHAWVTLMNTTFGMPISRIYTLSRGRYCRCVKKPVGVCTHDKATWPKCIGTRVSDHGYGDAFDIVGVRWVDPKAVGSSLPTTVIDDWKDPEQAKLLIRMNAAMRIVFHTVLDWSMENHRDHFHVDMNQEQTGKFRKLFSYTPEQNFIMHSLKRLNYVASAKGPHDWSRARAALADFAQVNNVTVPSGSDREAWRPIVNKLYACVALGIPGQCAKS